MSHAERCVHAMQATAATTTAKGPDTLQGLYPGLDKDAVQHKPGTRHHHNLAGARADALPKPAQVQAAGVGAAAVATQVGTVANRLFFPLNFEVDLARFYFRVYCLGWPTWVHRG